MAPAPVGVASRFACFIVIVSNLVGGGLLSLPFTFRRSGLLVGALTMLVMAGLATLSMVVIARCCDLSGCYSYKDIARAALGRTGAAFVTAVMAVYTFGSAVSFVVLLGDFLPALVCEDGCATPLQQLLGQRIVTQVAIGLLVLFPLCLPRQLNALRYTSAVSAVCIGYTFIMISLRGITGARVPAADIHLLNGVSGVFVSIPILAVTLCAHYNSAKFYSELADRSLGKFAAIVAAAFFVVLVVYEATAVSGYLLFGSTTKGDVLENFADNDAPAFAARIALSAIVIACQPLAFNALRGSVVALLPERWQDRLAAPALRQSSVARSGGSGGGEEGDEGDEALSGGDATQCLLLRPGAKGGAGAVAVGSARPQRQGRRLQGCAATVAADWPHALLTLALVLGSMLVAVLVPEVEVVLGYKGALGGSLIVYVFPALMLFSLSQQAALGLLPGVAGGGGGTAEGDDEGEGAPLARVKAVDAAAGRAPTASADGSTAYAPGVWSFRALVGTPPGWLLLAWATLGALVMVAGTLTTAGLL